MITLEQLKTLINGLTSSWLSPMRSAVSRAQTTSDQAQIVAGRAQNTADIAKTAADTAQSTADTAKATADNNEQNLLTIGTAPIQLPKGTYWAAAYGNGRYVVVGDSTGVYSEDGINWIPILDLQPDTLISWRSVVYGGGKFVAVSSRYWACSEDGIHWNTGEFSVPTMYSVQGVAYGDGKFVAVGGGFLYSEDGINWTLSHYPPTEVATQWYTVTYGNGRFLTVNSRISRAAYSENGINWVEVSLPYGNNLHKPRPIVYGSEKFVLLDNMNVYYTEDGIVWHLSTLPTTGVGLAYGNDYFLAKSSYTSAFLISDDGVSWWQVYPPNPPDAVNILEFLNGQFTAIGTRGAVAHAIPNIDHWTKTRNAITQANQQRDIAIKRILNSGSVVQVLSLDGSSKRFALAVDDSGTTTATEI